MSWLYNKRKPLLEVKFERGHITNIGEIVEENRHLLPVCLDHERLSLPGINKWLEKRKIPDKREGLSEARRLFRGFDSYQNANMFSLSDQYWIQHKSHETWDKLNFFTNHYSQEPGKIFFEPWNAKKEHAINDPSPDLTTNGVLRKRWIQERDKQSYLVKAGSVQYHQEPLSEVVGSLILKQLGLQIDFVEYSLVVSGLHFCSRCRNFITESEEFVPAQHIYSLEKKPEGKSMYDHFIDMCDVYKIPGVREYLDIMIAVDHILHNTDRHFGNFGFIRNVESGHLGFAPLFDFGRCYFGASAAQDITSKCFADMEERCFRRITSKHVLPDIETSAIQRIVRSYTGIRQETANLILCLVDEAADEIHRSKPLMHAMGKGMNR